MKRDHWAMESIKRYLLELLEIGFENNNDRGRVDTIFSDFRHFKVVVDKGKQSIKIEYLIRMNSIITLEEQI